MALTDFINLAGVAASIAGVPAAGIASNVLSSSISNSQNSGNSINSNTLNSLLSGRNLNYLSIGLHGATSLGSLINELNAQEPKFAPLQYADKTYLNKNTSAFENANLANIERSANTTLQSLLDRGVNPALATSSLLSATNQANADTLFKAESIKRDTMNREAMINSRINLFNADMHNKFNRNKEAVIRDANRQSGMNISRSLSELSNIPYYLGQNQASFMNALNKNNSLYNMYFNNK